MSCVSQEGVANRQKKASFGGTQQPLVTLSDVSACLHQQPKAAKHVQSCQHSKRGGAVANRLRRRTSDQTVLGSNPAVVAALSPWTRLFTPIVPRRSLHISFY